MAHLTRPAEISVVSAGLFPETTAGNRAYVQYCQLDRTVGCISVFMCIVKHVDYRYPTW